MATFKHEPESEDFMATKKLDLLGLIMDYESGELKAEDTLVLFGELIRTGQAWQLQGSIYGRPARQLIDNGYISEQGKILKHV
jgi:hypothetical protein